MPAIPLSDLEPGVRLAFDLRDGGGRLLLAARRPVSETVLIALNKRGVRELSFHEAEELPEAMTTNGPRRAWLMAAPAGVEGGVEGEQADFGLGENESREVAAVQSEERPAIEEPRVREAEHRREVSRVRSLLRNAADGIIAARTPRWRRLGTSITPKRAGLPERSVPAFASSPATTIDDLNERVEILRRTFARLAAGEAIGAGTPIALADELIDETDREPFGLLALMIDAVRSGSLGDDPAAHAYAVAGVCAAIALHLGWTAADARSATLTGLLADCGLTLLPWDIRSAARELTDVETNALRRHPAWSAGLIELIHDDSEAAMDEAVQLAVYQHHEREDGSGYPTRARGDGMIHDLARVAAVADSFVGLLSARAHRPGLSPESALAEVVRGASAGALARPMVRGLALSLGLRASTPLGEVVVAARSTNRAAA